MDLSKFAAPHNAPSVYYLSNPHNLDRTRQEILNYTFIKRKSQVISQLIDYLKSDAQNADNIIFAVHILDQLIKLNKKEPSPFIRRISSIGELTEWEKAQVLPYFSHVYMPLDNVVLPDIEAEVNELANEQLILHQNQMEEVMSYMDKKAYLIKLKGEIFYQKNYFLRAYQELLKATMRNPTYTKDLQPKLRKAWLMVEALQVGVNLINHDHPLMSWEKKLLKKSNPYTMIPNFLEDPTTQSAQYLSNFQQFSSVQRGILYMLYRRHFNGAFYSLNQYLEKTEEEELDWFFLVCIFDQLARICELEPSAFLQLISEGKEEAAVWKTDLRMYFELVYRHLLKRSLPDISAEVRAKGKDLTNKLQAKKVADWTHDEWQSTNYRAQAYVYKKRGYYPEIYHVAVAAKALSNLGSKDINTYISAYRKMVDAQEIGQRLATYHMPYVKSENENTIEYTFQISKKPTLYPYKKRKILDQLGIDIAALNEKMVLQNIDSDKQVYYVGQVQINDPNSVIISDANQYFINKVFEKLDPMMVKKITLNNCSFGEELPASIYQFKQLSSLNISGGNLKAIGDEFLDLTNLSYLYLSNLNQFSTLPQSFNKLSKLTHIQLYLDQLNTFPSLDNCQQMKWLVISNSQLKSFPKTICQLVNLELLSISHNQFTEIPSDIKNLEGLKTLKLYKNPWKYLPEEILQLSRLKEFEIDKTEVENMNMSTSLKTRFLEKIEATQGYRTAKAKFYRNIGK